MKKFLSILIVAGSILAMKPYFPDEMTFSSADNDVKLTLKKGKEARLKVKTGFFSSDTFDWTTKISYPSKALIIPTNKRIYLIGTHGDSGVGLGKVTITDFKGTLLHHIDLQKHIDKLKELSKAYGHEKGNFPWISAAKVAADNTSVVIEVCKKKRVTLDASGKVVTTDL